MVQGHLLPPFPDTLEEADSEAGALLLHQQRHLNASRNASGTPQPRGGGSSRGAGPPQGSPLEEQQQQLERQRRAQGMCYWSEAPERRKQQEQAGQPAAGGGGFSGGQPEVDERWASQVALWVADKCRHLCRRDQQAATAHQQAAQALHAALPLLPLPPGAPGLLRQRRCTACREVSAAVRHAELAKAHASLQAKRAKEATAAAKVGLSNLPAVAASGLAVNRQFLCVMEVRGWPGGARTVAFCLLLVGFRRGPNWDGVAWGPRRPDHRRRTGASRAGDGRMPGRPRGAAPHLMRPLPPRPFAAAAGHAAGLPGVRGVQGDSRPPDPAVPPQRSASELHAHTADRPAGRGAGGGGRGGAAAAAARAAGLCGGRWGPRRALPCPALHYAASLRLRLPAAPAGCARLWRQPRCNAALLCRC